MNFSKWICGVVAFIALLIAGLSGLLTESFLYCANLTPETVGLWYSVMHGVGSVLIFLVLLFSLGKAVDQTPPGGNYVKYGL